MDFMEVWKRNSEIIRTENGAAARNTSRSAVYDMFATGGAYRQRSDEDITLLFHKAYNEDKDLALKCLFYLRDCRGGQGERRFFRVAFNYLCNMDKAVAIKLLPMVAEYGRYDDLWYATEGTDVWGDALVLVQKQLNLDMECKTPSLLAKWMPSENASSAKTITMANEIRTFLGMTHKEYRKMLVGLRKKINVLETLMSANRWNDIQFDKIPSKAGLIYKNAFARRDIIARKYEEFAKSEDTKVNANTLYPYEIVAQACPYDKIRYDYEKRSYRFEAFDATDRAMINKYWENLPDYLNGAEASMMTVIDTSGSMTGRSASAPINTAIGLGIYCAERMSGPFAGHFISFSQHPQLINLEGIDFVDKAQRVMLRSEVANTNLVATFDLLKRMALSDPEAAATMPKTLVVISDMEIDYMSNWSRETAETEMERVRKDWLSEGLELPKLVYWNVNARNDTFLEDAGNNVTYVSGCSPIIFKSVLTGKTGYDLMITTLTADRYNAIKA